MGHKPRRVALERVDRREFAGVASVALRRGRLTYDQLADAIAAMPRGDRFSVSWSLMYHGLDDAALDALAARGLDAPPLADALMRRGQFAAAVTLVAEPWPSLVRDAIDLGGPQSILMPWIAHVISAIETTASCLERLTLAEIATPFMSEPGRRALLDDLVACYLRERDAGDYTELDYPYGEIDPCLRLVRALLGGGDVERGQAHLEERDRHKMFLNFEEIEACEQLTRRLPEASRTAWYWNMREWAVGADAREYRDGRYTAAWLVKGLGWAGDLVEHEIVALVEQAERPTLFRSLVSAPLPPLLRAHTITKLVALVAEMIALHVRAPTGAAQWPLLDGAAALAEISDQLGAETIAALAPAVADWTALFAKRTDSPLPAIQTAVAFSQSWPDVLEPAASKLHREIRGGYHYPLNVRGWDTLLGDKRADDVLDAL